MISRSLGLQDAVQAQVGGGQAFEALGKRLCQDLLWTWSPLRIPASAAQLLSPTNSDSEPPFLFSIWPTSSLTKGEYEDGLGGPTKLQEQRLVYTSLCC